MSVLDDKNEMAGYQKVYFHLQQDEDGYPPQEWESLWAKEIEPGLFQIDNIPFFVQDVSDEDVVSTEVRDGELHFKQLIRLSGHSVLRVLLYDVKDVDWLRGELRKIGCSSELSHIACLISVGVPPTASLDLVRQFLDQGEKEERWGYEEASIRHH